VAFDTIGFLQHLARDVVPDAAIVLNQPAGPAIVAGKVAQHLVEGGCLYCDDPERSGTISGFLQETADPGKNRPFRTDFDTKHGSQGNPAQTVAQYEKAFRRKSGESAAAAKTRMEARKKLLLAAGKLRE
jgi:hypothetical protein